MYCSQVLIDFHVFTFKLGMYFDKIILKIHTGCVRQNENPTNFKIVKQPLPVLKQTTPQQKALDFSFNLAP